MILLRVSLSAVAATLVGFSSLAISQEKQSLEDELAGQAPVVSKTYPGPRADDERDRDADQKRPEKRPERRYDDRRDRDRYDDRRDRYDDYDRRGRDRGDRHRGRSERIFCASTGYDRNICRLPRNVERVYLDERRSNASCRRGSDFGLNRRGLWVDNGCRGYFVVVYGRDSRGYDRYGRGYDDRWDRYDRYDDRSHRRGNVVRISCESWGRSYSTCELPPRFRSVERISRQSNNRCRRGEDWGVRRGYLWVDNGCRATFAVRVGRNGYRDRYSGGW